ncbi:capping protein (actin filament) muscle z- alpha 2 [Moniliophthora roreri MCA 2997]|uniref:F-actin-capping protein subunit alpha n=2 Tax=Moniliophthora roreri TaxID=221103 RepID=V2XUJ4_MONRO|nr:capping protein (actin filament) muscle z- alpha 2 [Moniliophthora roreri MCA 2997]
MDTNARIEAACGFLLQSPPGEINDVLNDVRNIISDDDSLQEGVLPALREYNLEQFITVDVPGTEHQSVISEAARIPGSEDGEERWLDPRSRTTFAFNHLTLEASDPQPFEPEENAEPLRSTLEKATITYLTAHFHDGVCSVFAAKDSANKFTIQVVANKYNPSNYWSGRWRSEYIVSLDDNTIQGRILVNVHYYEQGNVQLSTTHTVSIPLTSATATSPPNNAASKILALIESEEGKYQTSLNDTYHEMSEKTFKSLRRALPMTRQKLDWDKVLGYKLGAELSSSKGNFGTA